jgi:hypothetical protein
MMTETTGEDRIVDLEPVKPGLAKGSRLVRGLCVVVIAAACRSLEAENVRGYLHKAVNEVADGMVLTHGAGGRQATLLIMLAFFQRSVEPSQPHRAQ